MDVRFLGGAREIGRSAILVDDSLLLDYGMATTNPPSFPIGDVDPDAVVASHGHLDHVGALPTLLSGDARPPVHLTPPTYELAMLLARDTLSLHGGAYNCPFTGEDLKRLTEVAETHAYGESFAAAGHEVTLFNAGHVPGSAHVLVDDGETRLLYTGDFHVDETAVPARDGGDAGSADAVGGRSTEAGAGAVPGEPAVDVDRPPGQRLVAGSSARPDADAVICESTYADVEHTHRGALERRFADSVRTTIWQGGTVVVPAFAIGRTQELVLVCAAHDLDCYVDGMGQQVTDLFGQYPDYLRDGEAFGRAKSHARMVTGRDGQRKRIAADNTVIITTAGMLSGGPAMTYVPEIRRHPTNKIVFTGYQVEGTPGRDLLETGSAEIDGQRMPISAQVEQYDFSAHADRHGLRAFLGNYRDSTVLLDHGDDCEAFAADLRTDGFDAVAPALGDTITV